MKDVLIIILIISLVVIGNVISQNILKKDSEKLVEKLEKIKNELGSEEENITADELQELWEQIDKRWSILVSHQELDNIKVSIIAVKSSIESDDLSYAYQQINNAIFLVEHQTQKWAIKWKNIF